MDIGIIEAPTVKELFIQKITGMIIRGELKPGEKLPSERELAT
ncbi:MAG: GntR family transcriptional regulator [Solobacterium sp.]|nr:GntR family transcriptional regulator [Solobacterium sp.]